ncbi:MAG: class I SAM-dependent methyltransferase [Nanoarchaeota archaeon]
MAKVNYQKYYQELMLDLFWESPSEAYVWYQKKRKIISYLTKILPKIPDNSRFLDIACNTGKDMFMINKLLKTKKIKDYVGIDISQSVIDVAKAFSKREKLTNFHFYLGDITKDLPKSLGHFDVILCSELIEHLDHQDKFLLKIKSLLNPGGHLILTTPDKSSFIKKLILKLFPNVSEYQSWYFDRRGNHIKKEKEMYMVKNPTLSQHIGELSKKELREKINDVGLTTLKLESSCISYGSPVLDNNKFLFWVWLFIENLPLVSKRLGGDSCMLALLPKKSRV